MIPGLISHAFSIALILAVVWGVDHFYLENIRMIQTSADETVYASEDSVYLVAEEPEIVFDMPAATLQTDDGSTIRRASVPHTTFPTRPRRKIITYTVEASDDLFSIAQKFGLNVSSILWANNSTLRDDPHNLRPGQLLNILPGDGAYYEWHTGDSLSSVAEFYGVLPADIINSPVNRIQNVSITEQDLASGMALYIPGGKRDFVTWQVPRVTRLDPEAAKVLGKATCPAVIGGPVGTGSFQWPAQNRVISGYGYFPDANHFGIDIYGAQGDAVYAADAGVSVYTGWNDWGLGNIILLDHGNGWQSLYAQLGALKMGCGQMVNQGDIIAEMGTSGNSTHVQVHFELMNDEFGRVNPSNLLP